MNKAFGEKLTAAEVRALPGGTRVTLRWRNKHGFPAVRDCTVVMKGKSKRLACRDEEGRAVTVRIRDYRGGHYALGGVGGPPVKQTRSAKDRQR